MRRILLDSGLLVLLTVGALSRELIVSHKRLRAYAISDYELLLAVLNGFQALATCPHVLTEASNLLRQDPRSQALSRGLQALMARLTEQSVPSTSAMERREYPRLGLTDSVLLTLANAETTLLTSDLDLYLAASSAGYDAVNFNHLREMQA